MGFLTLLYIIRVNLLTSSASVSQHIHPTPLQVQHTTSVLTCTTEYCPCQHIATMADTADLPERKPRKSVAFANGETVVDVNGEVTQTTDSIERTPSADSHSVPNTNGAKEDAQVDEVTAMFEGLAKKKKKKPKKEDDDEAAAEEKTVDDDGEVDLSALKKKSKKKKAKSTEEDFEAKLAQAGEAEEGRDQEKEAAAEVTGLQEGDLVQGTGIWAHDETKPINYESLLSRFFTLLHDSHPDLASSGGKSYKIPPPQCLREGNKKTIFANLPDICKRMKRDDAHVIQFLFAELGTSGSTDGSKRLVIKGRFQQKQIENVLRRYIGESLVFSWTMTGYEKLTVQLQLNMSPARPADRLTPSSTRERTGCTSSRATPVDQGARLLRSRLVSRHRSARGSACKSRLKLLAGTFERALLCRVLVRRVVDEGRCKGAFRKAGSRREAARAIACDCRAQMVPY